LPDDLRPATVRARHAASLVVLADEARMLMGLRGARHRFMPNKLVFPGGSVDRADLTAPVAAPLPAATRAALERAANPALAHGLAVAAARELEEETGLSLGRPPALGGVHYLCRMVTPPGNPIRFNARFLLVDAAEVSGTLAGSGELEELRFYGIEEALSYDLAEPQRRVIERLKAWLAMPPEARAEERKLPVFRRRRWAEE
jgi:8-oxo-dGTP pyrophosphatase MutT (NUDIX family)